MEHEREQSSCSEAFPVDKELGEEPRSPWGGKTALVDRLGLKLLTMVVVGITDEMRRVGYCSVRCGAYSRSCT